MQRISLRARLGVALNPALLALLADQGLAVDDPDVDLPAQDPPRRQLLAGREVVLVLRAPPPGLPGRVLLAQDQHELLVRVQRPAPVPLQLGRLADPLAVAGRDQSRRPL